MARKRQPERKRPATIEEIDAEIDALEAEILGLRGSDWERDDARGEVLGRRARIADLMAIHCRISGGANWVENVSRLTRDGALLHEATRKARKADADKIIDAAHRRLIRDDVRAQAEALH